MSKVIEREIISMQEDLNRIKDCGIDYIMWPCLRNLVVSNIAYSLAKCHDEELSEINTILLSKALKLANEILTEIKNKEA
jgi:hypothetical protein